MSALYEPLTGFDALSPRASMRPLEARDDIFMMSIADIELHPQLYQQVPLFREMKNDFDEKIKKQFFMPEKTLDNVNPVDLLEPEVKDTKKGKKRKPKAKENDYSDLEIKETIHHSLKDRSCPECGSLMKELKPTISYELKYKPAEWFLIKHVIHNYVCPECSKESDGIVCVEPKDKPVRLIEGSVVTSSAVAGLAYNKYVLGMKFSH